MSSFVLIMDKRSRFHSFNMGTEVLRELYAYCWYVVVYLCLLCCQLINDVISARVAYTKVELQLKMRGIPYSYLNSIGSQSATSEVSQLQSSLARSVPGLCVQSSDILAGAPAAEAAMPNIRVIPLNWWSNKKLQVSVQSDDKPIYPNSSLRRL